MTPRDSDHRHMVLREVRNDLREVLGKASMPHLKVEWFNEPDEFSPLPVTATNFEMLINALLHSLYSEGDKRTILLLAHISSELVSLCELGRGESDTLEAALGNSDDDSSDLGDIPEAFMDAFEDEE